MGKKWIVLRLLPDQMSFCILYIPTKNKKEAQKIAEHLLDKKLIACANMIKSDSLYLWQGKKEKGNEVILLAKTKKDLFDTVVTEVEKIHSYALPGILKIPFAANVKYEEWGEESLK